MSQYEQALIAAGIPPEQAQRDAWANEMVRWANREHEMYGKRDDDEKEH